MIALGALAAALPAQALETAQRGDSAGRAPTCYSGPGGTAGAGEERPPVLISGLGTPTGLVPDTENQAAKNWFEQGLLLVWAYDEAEAIRAFRMAQSLDDDCALCWWGEALARSPTLNLQPPNVDLNAAGAAVSQALQRAGRPRSRLGPLGRALIDAMRVRAPDAGSDFDYEGYVQAMTRVARDFPESDAALTLAADAEIVRWSNNQAPLEGARGWLEKVLVGRNPNYSGAIHFYIHLGDIIEQPAIVVPYADRLASLAPAATHLIHMPSHTFYSTSAFPKAVAANRQAIAAYLKYEELGPAVSGYRRYLFAHDHHYAIQSALMYGADSDAFALARDFERRFPAQDPLFRIRPAHFAAPWYVYARHEGDDALRMGEPMLGYSDASRALSRMMWHYARGEVYARRQDATRAAEEASGIAGLLAGPPGRALDPESEALALIAQHVLEGRAAMLRGKPAEAAVAYRAAMNAQSNPPLAFDPPPFWYGTRRSLAAAMLQGGDPEGAKRQLGALFATWPDDPLGLLVYSRAEAAQGHAREAAEYLARARRLWAGGDVDRMPLALI
jgi:tetratricopeptide (TPR) repeat protein